MRQHSIVRGILAVSLCAPAVAAQLGGSELQAPPVTPEQDHIKVVVLLEQGISVGSVSAQAETDVLASEVHMNMHLLKSLALVPVDQAEGFASGVATLPGVLMAELLQPAGLPEIEACGEPVGASAQQCTIAFADGTPSDAEYHEQSSLTQLDYETVQDWEHNQHQPVVVAVIDTGVDPGHPALFGHITDNGWDFVADRPGAIDMPNGLDDDSDGWIDEAYGHGTFLSSVILLMNPEARIMPLRVLDADGNGGSFDVADAIYYAADRGVNVINLSLSMSGTSTAVSVALEYARYKGASIYVSAGNTGSDKVLFPANYDPRSFDIKVPFLPADWLPSDETVTAVASTDDELVKADFSAWGPEVDIVTPGVNIYGAMPGGGYAWWSGTSMSAAVASGAGSLLFTVVGADNLSHSPQSVLSLTAAPIDGWNPAYAGGLGDGCINAWYASYKAYKLAFPNNR